MCFIKLMVPKNIVSFKFRKKNGGTRDIKAPIERLALLQSRLAELLSSCVGELEVINPRRWVAAHGFYPGRTIVSNAVLHRSKRYVFNVDLENFFGTINFGRVRGYFIKDRGFELSPSVATILAQIACHENALPQGSPCSPMISNLVGNILDARLLAFAKQNRCIYSRYADDLTFSTNEKLFPNAIAVNVQGSEWIVGTQLQDIISRSGFTLNNNKTRMSLRIARQTVTGLVVNKKVNVPREYYRTVRAMCSHLFRTGSYHRKGNVASPPPEEMTDISSLEGMLSHIHFVRSRQDRSAEINKLAEGAGEWEYPKASAELYRRFLFYKHFVAINAPLIVPEGISDIVYLQCAIRCLASAFPALAETKSGAVPKISVKFLRATSRTRELMNLSHGAAGQANLIANYSNMLRKYHVPKLVHPVIILCDNDEGPKTVFKNAAKKTTKSISLSIPTPRAA